MSSVGHGAHDSARFDALLRNLITFGLAEPSPDGVGWRLSDYAQSRLDRFNVPPPVNATLLYIGHRCSVCREPRPTHRRDDRYVCDFCAGHLAAASPQI